MFVNTLCKVKLLNTVLDHIFIPKNKEVVVCSINPSVSQIINNASTSSKTNAGN